MSEVMNLGTCSTSCSFSRPPLLTKSFQDYDACISRMASLFRLEILRVLSSLRRQHSRHLTSAFDEVLHHRTDRSILERDDCNWPRANRKIYRQYFEREPVDVESEH